MHLMHVPTRSRSEEASKQAGKKQDDDNAAAASFFPGFVFFCPPVPSSCAWSLDPAPRCCAAALSEEAIRAGKVTVKSFNPSQK